MWEPFTERARICLKLAEAEAQRLGNVYVGTEHLLLGIVNEGENVGAKVLLSLGVDLNVVRSEVVAVVGKDEPSLRKGDTVFTPRAARVIELAFAEMRAMKHSYLGTEHLLLGLIREGEGVAARVLSNLGVDPSKIRAEVERMLTPTTAVPPPPRGVRSGDGFSKVTYSVPPPAPDLPNHQSATVCNLPAPVLIREQIDLLRKESLALPVDDGHYEARVRLACAIADLVERLVRLEASK